MFGVGAILALGGMWMGKTNTTITSATMPPAPSGTKDAKPTSEAPSVPPVKDKSQTASELAEQLAKKLQEEEVRREQPVIKRGTFNTAIPFVISSPNAFMSEGIIPYDDNKQDPLLSTYIELAAIARIPLEPQWDAKSRTLAAAPALTDAAMRNFIGRVLQYYIVRSIDWMQYPIQTISYEQGKGTTVNQTYVVSVPDEEEYPIEKLNALWGTLGLGLRFTLDAGQNDWIWRNYKLKVPRHTLISLSETLDSYAVRFEREGEFYLDFKITPTGRNQGIGTLPAYFHFSFPREKDIKDAYCYFFMMSMEFKWYGRDHSSAETYAEWGQGLFAGLQTKLVPPQDSR